jgi:hypothetical protein
MLTVGLSGYTFTLPEAARFKIVITVPLATALGIEKPRSDR